MELGTHSQQKNRKEEGWIVQAGTIFSAQSAWCLWVGNQHHFWWSTVGEVNWLCRQAGRVNKQSTYLYFYDHATLLTAKGALTVLRIGESMLTNCLAASTITVPYVMYSSAALCTCPTISIVWDLSFKFYNRCLWHSCDLRKDHILTANTSDKNNVYITLLQCPRNIWTSVTRCCNKK